MLTPAARIFQDEGCLRKQPERSIPFHEIATELDRIGKSSVWLAYLTCRLIFLVATARIYPHLRYRAQAARRCRSGTGLVDVQRVAAAHDVGRAINPTDAVGQIQGAIVMGVGAALTEEYIPGVSNGFANYILPMINAMPEIEVILVETPSLYGPHGAKGLGEAAILPTAPGIINALSRAIGVRIRQIPATPERVLKAINSLPS
jgi:xanthine dehydrogenase molybdopterin-binding subunit B